MVSEKELNAWWRGLTVTQKRLVQLSWSLMVMAETLRHPEVLRRLIGAPAPESDG